MKTLTLSVDIRNTRPIEQLLNMLDEYSDCIEEPLRTKLIIWADNNNEKDD